ncbi:hypothetical protein AB0E08_17580 [Streptomyces sp. NPDC048281]|uniref:hypothetical protein n=1 Tax=Streptomyces sp. NPDC048281 TaxID=3154715 RepID=UPI0034147E21
MHLNPRIGHYRPERLQVAHPSEIFEAITEANVEIVEGNAVRPKAFEDLAQIPPEGP